MSCTLDPKKLTGAPDTEIENLKKELDRSAAVSYRQGMAIVSLICNIDKTSEIMTRVRGEAVRGELLCLLSNVTSIFPSIHVLPIAQGLGVQVPHSVWFSDLV